MYKCKLCKYTAWDRKLIRDHVQEKHKQTYGKSNPKAKSYHKGSVGGMVLGAIVLLLCFFLVTMTRQLFPDLGTSSQDMLNIVIIFIGISAIFLGIVKK